MATFVLILLPQLIMYEGCIFKTHAIDFKRKHFINSRISYIRLFYRLSERKGGSKRASSSFLRPVFRVRLKDPNRLWQREATLQGLSRVLRGEGQPGTKGFLRVSKQAVQFSDENWSDAQVTSGKTVSLIQGISSTLSRTGKQPKPRLKNYGSLNSKIKSG